MMKIFNAIARTVAVILFLVMLYAAWWKVGYLGCAMVIGGAGVVFMLWNACPPPRLKRMLRSFRLRFWITIPAARKSIQARLSSVWLFRQQLHPCAKLQNRLRAAPLPRITPLNRQRRFSPAKASS